MATEAYYFDCNECSYTERNDHGWPKSCPACHRRNYERYKITSDTAIEPIIIGKKIEEIRELDIDVHELSDRQLCYIVALGMDFDFTIATFAYRPGFRDQGSQWPDYTESWDHAGRVLEALPWCEIYGGGNYEGYNISVPHYSKDNPGRSPDNTYVDNHSDFKKAITKAAAKCALEGIELEVSE